MKLTYQQRKALRRLGRGQTISRTQEADPLIQSCIEPIEPPIPPEDMNIVEWCDWEAIFSSRRLVLNEKGLHLLAEIS
jgi:hypothetical protein